MHEYTIQAQSARLYIRTTADNVYVVKYRAKEVGAGMEALYAVGTWQRHATPSCQGEMNKMELVRMIQSMSGDAHNEIIQHVLTHKTSREQGDSASTKNTIPKSDGSSSQKPKAMSRSLYQRLKSHLR